MDSVPSNVDGAIPNPTPPLLPREGWEAAFQEMAERGDDKLIDGDCWPATEFEKDDWKW